MGKLINRFWKFPFFIQLIFLLCVLGALINVVLLTRDVLNSAVLWRLHLGFLILYVGQAAFILTQEKYVSLLTLLQGIMALLTTADFIFVPLLQVFGRMYYWLFSPSVESMKIYQYVFMSAAFTLQMASAAYLWGYFYKNREELK
ncbi:MAG: hypothetical protein IJ876_03430 [Elusimicrobiaceae bacterium]|nr:hypothetical protein [Elusimicrobiaceae bacterium]